jgi:Na+-driven multidrug efflux pump
MLLERVYAQPDLTVPETAGRFQDIGNVFGFVINLVIGIGWALVFVMLALGFVQYVMSRGEKTAVESAQKWLTYAVIGGVGLFFISFIRRIIPNLIDETAIDVDSITNF